LDRTWALTVFNAGESPGESYQSCIRTEVVEEDGAVVDTWERTYDAFGDLILSRDEYTPETVESRGYERNSDGDITLREIDYGDNGTIDHRMTLRWSAPGVLEGYDWEDLSDGSVGTYEFSYNEDGTVARYDAQDGSWEWYCEYSYEDTSRQKRLKCYEPNSLITDLDTQEVLMMYDDRSRVIYKLFNNWYEAYHTETFYTYGEGEGAEEITFHTTQNSHPHTPSTKSITYDEDGRLLFVEEHHSEETSSYSYACGQ